MIKILQVIVQVLFWLQAFAAPFLLSGIIAFIIYSKNEKNEWIALLVLIIGLISGIIVAEFIRRHYGLDTFFSRIY